MSLRRLLRRFFPRRPHPILDAVITPAPRDDEFRVRYAAVVAGDPEIFVTQRFEEGRRWREVVKAFASEARRVLDVGAGNGAIELALAADPAAFVVSVDAIWNTTAAGLGVRRVLADAAALPFRPGVFDAVLCLETIEHVAAPRTVAAEIARVAANGAAVLVTTPPKWRYALKPDPHFGIPLLTLAPPSLQRRIIARHGYNDTHHYVDRIYRSVPQLRRVFRDLQLAAVLSRERGPKRWFWDAVVFRKAGPTR